MTGYLLDTNVFIQAKNLHYGFDFCPAFWDWLDAQNMIGKVASIERVADELRAGADDLTIWAKERGSRFFLSSSAEVVPALNTVSNWASDNGYHNAAISTFLKVADFWLVAHALAHDHIVVTHEVPAKTQHKIKIPDACAGLGLRCVNPYEMLRRERARFILRPGKEIA